MKRLQGGFFFSSYICVSTISVNKSSVLWEYVDAQDMGVTVNRDKAYYDFLQTATLQDVVKFQQQWVKGRTYYFAILGDKKHLDMKALKQMGEVVELTTEDIFGYWCSADCIR